MSIEAPKKEEPEKHYDYFVQPTGFLERKLAELTLSEALVEGQGEERAGQVKREIAHLIFELRERSFDEVEAQPPLAVLEPVGP